MYNQSNYKKVREEYDLKRVKAKELADAHKAEIYRLSPEIAEIDKTLCATGLRVFKIACDGGDTSAEMAKLREENDALIAERAEILMALGYPTDYMKVKYECEKCHDTGFVDTKMCGCMKRKLIREGFISSGLGYLINEQSFESFDLSYYPDNSSEMQSVVRFLRKYAESFGEGAGNLLFVGDTGLGKTHLATSIAKVVIENGFDVYYESASNIISDFEAERFRNAEENSRTDKYFSSELLIIDDLGVEMNTQFSLACMYNVINTRINRRLPTIISTNLDIMQLNDLYDARISSRLLGHYSIISFKGSDIRIERAMKDTKK